MNAPEAIVLLVCVALSFFFSGIETGLLSLNKIRLRDRVRRHDPRAMILQRYLDRPERLLATVLVGNNLVNVTATVVAVHSAMLHWPLPPRTGGALAVVMMVLVLLIVGELVPKSLFRLYPFRLSMMLARPLQLCAVTMTPLTVTFEFLASAFMRLAGLERAKKELFVSREELIFIAREGELASQPSAEQRKMIAGVFEMCATPVRDVMVPMAQVLAVTPQTSIAEVLRQAREHSFSQLPVLDAAGNLAGVINVYEILFSDSVVASKTAADFCRPAPTVDSAEPLDRALARLRGVGLPMAVVLDVKKRPLGVVMITDLVEKIVGEIEL
ncbi:MAG: CNNM domain-containing protein [Verrucomicrobia bacterium]|nr:CNNM domain-containing protein [Verrucomicrobiota bacterium]